MAHHTTQKDINAVERAKQALDLRKQGCTLEQIAERCGYQDKSGAYRAIKRELDRLPTENALELRKVELMRLEQMHEECWLLAMDRKNRGRMFAMDRLIAISERRSKLMGLDVKPDAIPDGLTVIREYGVKLSDV